VRFLSWSREAFRERVKMSSGSAREELKVREEMEVKQVWGWGVREQTALSDSEGESGASVVDSWMRATSAAARVRVRRRMRDSATVVVRGFR